MRRDGRQAPLYRANVSFRGVWVPEGEHGVEFRFGARGQYVLKYFVMAVFYGMFGWWMWTMMRGFSRAKSARRRHE